jgi:hypothetical protein
VLLPWKGAPSGSRRSGRTSRESPAHQPTRSWLLGSKQETLDGTRRAGSGNVMCCLSEALRSVRIEDSLEQLESAATLIDSLARRVERAITAADDAERELTLAEVSSAPAT